MVTQCTGLLLEALIKGQGAGIRRARAHQPRSKETMTSSLHSPCVWGHCVYPPVMGSVLQEEMDSVTRVYSRIAAWQ